MCSRCGSNLHYEQGLVRLDEETYKELIADMTNNNVPGAIVHNLPHRDWAPFIKSSHYVGHRGNTFKFFVPNKYNGWNVYVRFDDYNEQIADNSLNATEVARLLLWAGNLRLHCGCPSFKFWGHQYVLNLKDSAIFPETRYPAKRNPNLEGGLCKHMRVVLRTLPFHLGKIASAVVEDRRRSK